MNKSLCELPNLKLMLTVNILFSNKLEINTKKGFLERFFSLKKLGCTAKLTTVKVNNNFYGHNFLLQIPLEKHKRALQ